MENNSNDSNNSNNLNNSNDSNNDNKIDLSVNQNQKSTQEISFEGHVPNHLIEQYNQIFMNLSNNETEEDEENEEDDEEYFEKYYKNQKGYTFIFKDQLRRVKKVNYHKPSRNYPGHYVSQSIHKKILLRNAKQFILY